MNNTYVQAKIRQMERIRLCQSEKKKFSCSGSCEGDEEDV